MENKLKTSESWEVELAEEGTPLAVFQKERTDAISEMFDNAYGENGARLYPTSKFFARLDRCFSQTLSTEKAKWMKEWREKLPKRKDGRNFVIYADNNEANFQRGQIVGYNQALDDIIKLIKE